MNKNKSKYLVVGVLSILIIIVVFLKLKSSKFTSNNLINNNQDLSQQFILMGDVGTAAPQQFAVSKSIESKCDIDKNCTGIFILGDIIYENGISSSKDKQLTQKLEEPYENIDLPFYLVLGNHDYKGCADCYMEYVKNNTKWKFPDRYYQKDFNEIAFFVIDTENFDIGQQKWLKESIDESNKKWKVVLGHRPIISEEDTKKTEEWNGRKQLEDIVCNSTNFYISGHAHLLEDRGNLQNCKTHLLISGAGGSYVRKIAQPFTGKFFAEENGFLSLSVSGDKVNYVYVNKDGKVLHEREIQLQ